MKLYRKHIWELDDRLLVLNIKTSQCWNCWKHKLNLILMLFKKLLQIICDILSLLVFMFMYIYI